MHIYGSVGPFHLMEVPTMRLPNVKMLLRWPSRMHIYCFVEITLYLCTMHLLLIWSLLMQLKSSCYERGGDGDFSSTAGPQARGPRPSAKMSESRCLLKQTASSKRNLRMAGGAKFALANSEFRAKFARGRRSEISKQGAERCCEKVSDGGPKRSIAWSISLSYALETKVWNLIDGTIS